MTVCLKKPDKIICVYGDTRLEIDAPEFFDKIFFKADQKTLDWLDNNNLLKEGNEYGVHVKQ